MGDVYQELSQLTEQERQLLEMLLDQEGVDLDNLILPQDRIKDTFPLSATQQRLWEVSQIDKHTALGNVPIALRLFGSLDRDALGTALNQVVARHEVLRTLFRSVDGVPMQTILPDWRPELKHVDLSTMQKNQQEQESKHILQAEAHYTFDFEREPSFRATLVILGEQDHILSLTMNHLVTDGWGARILLTDLSSLYAQQINKSNKGTLPVLDIQYADYSVWHNEWLQSSEIDSQVGYWQTQLQDAPKELHFRTKRDSAAVPSYESTHESFVLPVALTTKLRNYSQSQGVTLYTMLLASWQLLLHAYTNSADIVTGTIISNRNRRELENLVGNFGNNLLLRCQFVGDSAQAALTFPDILKQVHTSIMDAYQNQDLPLERLDQILFEQGRGGQLPSFKTMFMLRESAIGQNLNLPNIQVDSIPVYPNRTALDLVIDIIDDKQGLNGSFEYKTSLYQREFVAEMVEHYCKLLGDIATYADDAQVYELIAHIKPIAVQADDITLPAYVPAQTETEHALVEMWQSLLGSEQIGINDSFFNRGGHSLAATRFIGRVRQLFAVEIDIQTFFQQPTIGGLAQIIDQKLSASESEPSGNDVSLLSFPLEGATCTGNSHPASAAQRRIWFIDQIETHLTSYNVPFAFRLGGDFNREAFQRSIEAIVTRHSPLRTRFKYVNGEVIQVAEQTVPLNIKYVDLSATVSHERESELKKMLSADANQPFNLEHGPVFRASLFHLTEDEHVFLFNVHHIVFDGWSTGIFYSELKELYTAFATGDTPRLVELPASYVDYTYWQNELLQSPTVATQLAYWKRQLAGAPPLLEVPTDFPRPAKQTFTGATFDQQLSPKLAQKLKELSQQENASLFMTLLAAFQTLLHRYTNQNDILVGSPMAGRDHPDLEPLIGMFVTTQVMRAAFEDDPSFSQILRQVSVTTLEALSNQQVPFEQLVEELQPERSLSYNPIFQFMFVFQNTPNQIPGNIGNLEIKPEGVELNASMLDLTLYTYELGDTVSFHVEYNTALFKEQTVQRMMDHLELLLNGVVNEPDIPISTIPLLTEQETRKLLIDWNHTKAPYRNDACLHQLFEEQALRTPDAVAAIFTECTLTYAELRERSAQLANFLRARGVEHSTLVGVYADRSPEMLIGLLGILMAGGAYVPLDPKYPLDRIRYMIEDTKMSLLLTTSLLEEQLPPHQAFVIRLDTDWSEISGYDSQTPPNINVPDDVALVIYTSGSTGKPKGVKALHRAHINRFSWMWDTYPFRDNEVCCQKTSLNFVDSVWEIFGPLLKGVPTVYIPNDVLNNSFALVQMLAEHRVSRLLVVPSLLGTLLDSGVDLQNELPDLHMWITSGEALTIELASRFKRNCSDRLLLNFYGSSEVAADVTFCEVKQPEQQSSIPIGRPIANTQLYILNSSMSLVPMSGIGEIYVGGDNLAAGYLYRDDLTAERFVPNPFDPSGISRLYRTGDLGRYRLNGMVEYVGRTDHQVKIRGFRIELGEIEAVLLTHDCVQQAIVMARDDIPGGTQLIGYVTCISDEPTDADNEHHSGSMDTTADTLKEYLRSTLPDYMIPLHLMVLDAFPLTPNGKVNRLELQTLPIDSVLPQQLYVAPRNSLEEQLVTMWESLLERDSIGIHDNFFDLGGHSLLAVRLFAKIYELTGENLMLNVLFESPTIEGLAKTLSVSQPAGGKASITNQTWSPLITIQPGQPEHMPFYCIHGAGGNVLNFRELALHMGEDIPFYGLQAQGIDGVLSPHRSIADMATCYLSAIRSLQPNGPYQLGGYSGGGVVAYEMAQRLQAQREKVEILVLLDTFRPGLKNRRLPISTHVKNILHQGTGYVKSKLETRAEHRQHEQKRREIVERALANGEAIPIEVRDWYLTTNFVGLLDHYQPQAYSGPTALFSAAELWAIYDHVDEARGWGELIPNLDVQLIPGDHDSVVAGNNVRLLANKLRKMLIQNG